MQLVPHSLCHRALPKSMVPASTTRGSCTTRAPPWADAQPRDGLNRQEPQGLLHPVVTRRPPSCRELHAELGQRRSRRGARGPKGLLYVGTVGRNALLGKAGGEEGGDGTDRNLSPAGWSNRTSPTACAAPDARGGIIPERRQPIASKRVRRAAACPCAGARASSASVRVGRTAGPSEPSSRGPRAWRATAMKVRIPGGRRLC